MVTGAAVTFAVVLPGLLVAHQIADHWVQTCHQAATKGLPGREGQWACAAHIATYTLTTTAVVALLWAVFGLPISPLGFATGQVVSAVSHYWSDRRAPLAWLAHRLGLGEFYRLGEPRVLTAWCGENPVWAYQGGRQVRWDNPSLGTGAYALHQSWHWFWLLITALITAVAP